jgi:hypothetical protein
MANTLTNINDTKIMEQGLQALNYGLSPLRVFTLDAGSQPTAKNQLVYVPLATARSGETWSSTYESGNTTVVGYPVNCNTHLFASWHITEEQAMATPTNAFELAAGECMKGLVLEIQNTVFNVITQSNFGSTENTDEYTLAAGSFDVDAVAHMRMICTKTNKWDLEGSRALVLDGAYMANLLKDPAVQDRSASGKDALVSGRVGGLMGFDLYENNSIVSSTPGSGGELLVGFAAVPRAIGIAIRPVVPLTDGQYAVSEVVTDPQSGVSYNYRRWINTSTGTLWGSVTVLMGAAKIDASGLVAVRSA